MTVSSTTNRVSYAGNGTTVAFSFPYYFLSTSDLLVTSTDTSGNITTFVLGTDYTVSGTPAGNGTYPNGGTVATTVAPTIGHTLSLVRIPSDTQPSSYPNSNETETSLDKLTLLVQRVMDLFSSRGIPTLPDGFTASFSGVLPTVMTPNYGLVVNSGATGWTLAPVAASSSGTVTSVGLVMPADFTVGSTPVTSSGSLSVSWANQSANKIHAGPASGSANTPTWRSLVVADMPTGILATGLSSVGGTNGQVLTSNGSGASSWTTISSGGTVTSIGITPPSFMTATSAVTTSGTVTLAFSSQGPNEFFSSPSGSSGAPTFRAIVVADLPGMGGASSGSGGTAGLVPVPNAGQQVDFLRGDGTWQAIPLGTVTSVALTVPPEFANTSAITSSGAIAITKANQSPNKVWAGPASGALSAVPTFRSLVAIDLPIFTGCTSISSGVIGAVPSPSAGQQSLFLRGDGTWSLPSVGTPVGPFATPTISISSTLASLQQFAVVSGNTGPINVTLPPANTMIQVLGGNSYASPIVLVNDSAFAVTILPDGPSGDTIDHSASATLTLEESSYTLFPTPTGWLIT